MKKNCSIWHCRQKPFIGVRGLKEQYCAVHLSLLLSEIPGGNTPLSREEVEQLVKRLVERGLIGVAG